MVVGGEDAPLIGDILPGSNGIVYEAGTATSTFVYPAETIAAWNTFIRGQTGASKVAKPEAAAANGAFRTLTRSTMLAGLMSCACLWLL